MATSKISRNTVISITADITLMDAARIMKEKNADAVVVIKKRLTRHFPIGILTHNDIMQVLTKTNMNLSKIKVREIIEEEGLILKADDNFQQALQKMCDEGVRRAPI